MAKLLVKSQYSDYVDNIYLNSIFKAITSAVI